MTETIRQLIKRLARLDSQEGWSRDINPAQRQILEYLARANRFSRSPSHVADYLGSTRGTVSQSLKSLLNKGHVTEDLSQSDKRSISYELSKRGGAILRNGGLLNEAISSLPKKQRRNLEGDLREVLSDVIKGNSQRPFGLCCTCRHFAPRKNGGYCLLLSEALAAYETEQICHEHEVG